MIFILLLITTVVTSAPFSADSILETVLDSLTEHEYPPTHAYATFDKVLDKLEDTRQKNLAMSPEKRIVFLNASLIACDFDKTEEKRRELVNSLLESSNLPEEDIEAIRTEVLSELEKIRSIAEKTPLCGKYYLSLYLKMTMSDKYLNGSREDRRTMLWRSYLRYTNKAKIDPRLREEVKDGIPHFE